MDVLTKLEKLFNDFNMIGQDGITVHGDLHRGYAVNTQTSGPSVSLGGGGNAPPPPPLVTGICCENGDCSVTTEEDCGGLWFETNFTCPEVKCCHPYFEIHVQVTINIDDCEQIIDLTAIHEVDTVELPDGCCMDQIFGNFGAVDENGNTISGSITSSSGGTFCWFVNVVANCPIFADCAFTSDCSTGDCDEGGAAHYDIDNDSEHCSAVGTIDITWHG